MENLWDRVILLAVLAAFGLGLIGGYLLVAGDVSDGGQIAEGAAIVVSTANMSSTGVNNSFMNLQFQQEGQVVGEVNIPVGHQMMFQGMAPTQVKSSDSFFFVNIPVDVSKINLSSLLSRGDVLFCGDGASLVVLDPGRALYLDFGLQICDLNSYQKIGSVGDGLMSTLSDEDLSLWEKQSALWYAQGLDLLSLNVTWQNNVGGGFEEVFEKIGGIQPSTQMLQDADVDVEFESEGYSRVRLRVSASKKTQSLLVKRGFALENLNKDNQNLAFGEAILVYMPKNKSKSFFIRSYCINAGRGVPSREDKLVVWKNVPGNVQEAIDQNYVLGRAGEGAGQQIVWEQTG